MGTIYSGAPALNNLELYFDTTSNKSYSGEPTVNLITDTSNFGSAFWTHQSGTIVPNVAVGPRGISNAASITAVNTDPYIYSSEVVTVGVGTVTWAIDVKGTANTVGQSAQLRINFTGTASGTDASQDIVLTLDWQRVTLTTTVTVAGTIKFGIEAPDGAVAGDVMYVADPQFEQNNHATQFVEGTRTAGLTDLVKKQTLDVTDVSYNEFGEIIFNGTSDEIKTGNFSLDFGQNSFTLEAWVYPFDNTAYAKIINKGQSGAFPEPDKGYSLRFLNTGATLSVSDGANTLSTTVQDVNDAPANEWTHIVGVIDRASGEQKLYINGELNNSTAITYGDVSAPSAELTIGSLNRGVHGATSEWFSGRISLARIYTTALSPYQVKRNYKATFERVRTVEPGIVQSAPVEITPPPPPPAGTNDDYLLIPENGSYLHGVPPSVIQNINWSQTPITISVWVSPDWESPENSIIYGFRNAGLDKAFWLAWNNNNSGFFARFRDYNVGGKLSWRQRWWHPYRAQAVTGVNPYNGIWSKRNLGNTDTYGDREWVHLVLTHDPSLSVTQGGMDLYWNGNKMTSTFSNRNGLAPNWTPSNFALGGGYNVVNLPMPELPRDETLLAGLDEFKLYDRVLSSSEVLNLYNEGINNTTSLYSPIYEVSCTTGANPELGLYGNASFQTH